MFFDHKGQVSAEILMILAAVLFVIVVALYVSNEQFTSIAKTKEANQAAVAASDIASAADEVYFQGYGARKRLLVMMPPNLDVNKTYINGSTIMITSSGNSITADSQAPLKGSLPLVSGHQEVWVVSEGSYVRIGNNAFLSITPNALFYTLYEDSADQDTITIQNVFDGDVNVSISLVWPHSSKVQVQLSDTFIELQPDDTVQLDVSVDALASSAGIYDGDIVINSTDGDTIDTIYVPLTVYVIGVSQNQTTAIFYIYPDSWNTTIQQGQTQSKYFYVCTYGISVNQVEFIKSGTAGGWVWNDGPIGPIPSNGCSEKVFYLTVPAGQAPGEYSGAIIASADGGLYTDNVSLNIKVIAPVDTQGPITGNLVVRAASPNPAGVIHAFQDDVIVNATCDDTTRGNSDILRGEVSTSITSCSWGDMLPMDGAYDSPVEGVTKNMGTFAQGSYFAVVRCIDEWNNVGATQTRWFNVRAADNQGPDITSLWLSPSSPGTSQNITVNTGASDWSYGSSIIKMCYTEMDFNGVLIPMAPTDGAYDTPYEGASVTIPPIPNPGSHTVTVHCHDYYDNVGSRNRTFTVVDDLGPLSLELIVSPSHPVSGQQVTAYAIGDDTGRGNSNINLCQVRLQTGPWRNMNPVDGAYDSSVEEVFRGIGSFSSGEYTLQVRCRQAGNNLYGPVNQTMFKVS